MKYVIAIPLDTTEVKWLYFTGYNNFGFDRDIWKAQLYDGNPSRICEMWKDNHDVCQGYNIQDAIPLKIEMEVRFVQ